MYQARIHPVFDVGLRWGREVFSRDENGDRTNEAAKTPPDPVRSACRPDTASVRTGSGEVFPGHVSSQCCAVDRENPSRPLLTQTAP